MMTTTLTVIDGWTVARVDNTDFIGDEDLATHLGQLLLPTKARVLRLMPHVHERQQPLPFPR